MKARAVRAGMTKENAIRFESWQAADLWSRVYLASLAPHGPIYVAIGAADYAVEEFQKRCQGLLGVELDERS